MHAYDKTCSALLWRLAGRRSRWLQAAAGAALLFSAVFALASLSVQPDNATQITSGPVALESDEMDGIEETKPVTAYCSVFVDPSECEKQKVDGISKYWSNAEVRYEVWKTMNALAELELREMAQHKASKAKAQEQSSLFTLFRETMAHEVEDIHRIQNEMHHKHTVAFQQLVDQIINITHTLRAHTDEGTAGISERIARFNKTEASDYQLVLRTIMQKMNAINREVEGLHKESMAAVNATNAYAQEVKASMLAGDNRLQALITALQTDAESLDGKEGGDFDALSAALSAAERKQFGDNQALSSKIDTDVGALRNESAAALAAERLDMRSQLAQALRIVYARLNKLNATASSRQDVLQQNISDITAAQDASNAEQEAGMTTLRRNFERDRKVAFGRLDAADVRIDAAFAALAAARSRLAAEAAADYAFLQATIDEGVATRDAEAAAVREWAHEQTARVNQSLTHTQALLGSERPRLQQQRDEDLALMSAKVDNDVAAWNASFNAQMDRELQVTHDLLSNRMSQAQEALQLAQARLSSRGAGVEQQFDGLKALQESNNALQQRAIDDLQRDTVLEDQLSAARAAALHGNISQIHARLLSIKGEVLGTQNRDRAEVRARIVSDFDSTKERLEAELSRQHSALWNKLGNATGRIKDSLDKLHQIVYDRETALLDFDDGISGSQRKFKTSARLEMDDIDRTQRRDRRSINDRVNELIDALTSTKARLDSELARVAQEEQSDDGAFRRKIDDENNATAVALDSKADALHALLQRQTHDVMLELTAKLDGLKHTEGTDHGELMGNLSAWQDTQEAENRRQKAWLQDIKESCEGAATGIGQKMAALRKELTVTDHTLTAQGEALETEQRKKAAGVDASLHADIAALRTDELAFIARTKSGVLHAIKERADKLRAHLDALNSSALDTKKEIEEATEAMSASIAARRDARISEMQGIRVKAAHDKGAFDARISSVLQHISADTTLVHKELGKSAAAQQAHSASVKRYIDASLATAVHNSTDATEQAEEALGSMISEAAVQWMRELEEARQASDEEASKVQSDFTAMGSREAEHKRLMTARIASLVEAVERNEDSMDLALATLRSGLTEVQHKLNETDRVQRQAQLEDTARIRSQIHEGMDELRVNASIALSTLRAATSASITSRSKVLDARRLAIRTDMRARENQFLVQVATTRKEQESMSSAHQSQILQFKLEQLEVTKQLGILSATLDTAERLAHQKLHLRQNSDSVGQSQQLRDLAAKLDRAESQLNSLMLDTNTAEQKAMQEAKSALGQAKVSLLHMHAALVSEQTTDAVAIKSEVVSGIATMQESVTAAIREAAQKIKGELHRQLAALDSNMNSVSGKVADATQELNGRMSTLQTAEDSHDAEQEVKINDMTALLNQGNAALDLRTGQLGVNISIVNRLMREGLDALTQANDEDKPRLLALLPRAVSAARTTLGDTLASTVIELRAAIADRLHASEAATAAERASSEAKEALMDEEIHRLSGGDMAFDAKWAGDVATIADGLQALRKAARHNVTGLLSALSQSEQALARDQLALFSPELREAGRKAFGVRQDALHADLARNFSLDLAVEVTRVRHGTALLPRVCGCYGSVSQIGRSVSRIGRSCTALYAAMLGALALRCMLLLDTLCTSCSSSITHNRCH